jgi:hypothetical protein
MSDVPPGSAAQAQPFADHRPFPITRLLYAIGFAFLAWVVLWIVFELLAFVTFARDNLPFPIGPFPRAGQ